MGLRFLDTPRSACYKQPASDEQDPPPGSRLARLTPMLRNYIPIFLFILIAAGFAVFTILASKLVHADKPNTVKLEPYECGIEAAGDARGRYSVRYYLIAMLFVIFDVETVFMFPWAVSLDKLAVFGLVEMLVFLFILVVGYFYAWRKGALEWQL
jgi:NADH-quinone oxidoreductase subunit A